MASHWVYSGFSGTLESCFQAPYKYRACYEGEGGAGNEVCDCYGTHPDIEGNHPTDVSQTGNTSAALIVSNTIKSFKTTRVDGNVCGGTTCTGDEDDSLKVELFTGLNGTGTNLGTVWYMHVKDRIADGTRNTGYYSPSKSVWYNICKIPPGSCTGCYIGPHIHYETSGSCISSVGCSGSNCPTYTVGSTALYCFFT